MNKLYRATNLFMTMSILILYTCVGAAPGFGQEVDTTGKLPVKSTFTALILIETPTVMNPYKNSLTPPCGLCAV